MTEITSGVTQLITLMGNVVTALFGETGAFAPLLPYFALSIAVSVILLGIKGIRSLVWGA